MSLSPSLTLAQSPPQSSPQSQVRSLCSVPYIAIHRPNPGALAAADLEEAATALDGLAAAPGAPLSLRKMAAVAWYSH